MVGHGLVKTGGVWKEPIKISAKTGGVWKDLTAGFVRTAGAWQQFYPSVIVDPTLVLDLDFTNMAAGIDPRVTFSRTTPATMIDATGLVVPSRHNRLFYSNDFGQVAVWTLDGVTLSGNTLTENTANSLHRIYHQVGSYPSGSIVMISFEAKYISCPWVAVNHEFGRVWFNIQTGTVGTSAGGITGTITATADGYYRCAVAAVASTTGTYGIIDMASADGVVSYPGTSRQVQIRRAQMEVVNSLVAPVVYVETGATAPLYGARFDHDPVTLAARGLLIEEQRTNLLPNSSDFTTGWAKGNTLDTVTANALAAPDGTMTADQHTSAVTSDAILYQGGGNLNGVHTTSFFVKPLTMTWVYIRTQEGATQKWAYFNIATGVVGTVDAGVTAKIEAFPNGWYRVNATYTHTNAGPAYAIIGVSSANGSPGAAGETYFVWGAQQEAGAFATSYIPTTSAAVTRAADSASMTGTNFSSWWNATEGTFVLEMSDTSLTSVTYLNVNEASWIGNRVVLYNDIPELMTFIAADGPMQSNDVVSGTLVANTVFKTAIALKVNDVAACLNGGPVVADTSVTLPPADRLYFGADESGIAARVVRAHFKRLSYYNVRKSNAELQALTT